MSSRDTTTTDSKENIDPDETQVRTLFRLAHSHNCDSMHSHACVTGHTFFSEAA